MTILKGIFQKKHIRAQYFSLHITNQAGSEHAHMDRLHIGRQREPMRPQYMREHIRTIRIDRASAT